MQQSTIGRERDNIGVQLVVMIRVRNQKSGAKAEQDLKGKQCEL